ncbi:MAG: hypothetical protein QGG19_11405 [Alphaproteobacteria bacterium]|nr:hypothetical protein [Alphaproteobacteria bacterium]MDP6254258.1 hypothetical protein [Alphaproteobacteria bacterium]MDP7054600.1 hypothetical protein [Alphaproteobacteria bacterium]MDP7227113.1 hypothetical protein [Alphaproteobacteria bacterium]MDP7462519.1 hypothetical protein [Alphaproteobacteria bacterium]
MEQVLNNHPAISESAVIGVKRAVAGGEEEVMAVVIGGGEKIEKRALLDRCVQYMPHYAVPRFVVWVDGLEKTATGKIQKQGLRDAGVTTQT